MTWPVLEMAQQVRTQERELSGVPVRTPQSDWLTDRESRGRAPGARPQRYDKACCSKALRLQPRRS